MPSAMHLSNGFDCCVFCWQAFGGEGRGVNPGIGGGVNYTHGPVVQALTGEEFEAVCDSKAGTPLAHPECRKEWAEAIRDSDSSLWKFAEVADD